MTLSKVKPCPFCGSKDTDCNGHYVSCADCHSGGPDETLPDGDWVIARWNRRPVEDRLHAEIERLNIQIAELEGKLMTDPEIKSCPFCGCKDAELVFDYGDNGHYWAVLCRVCGATGTKKHAALRQHPTDAINSWNRACASITQRDAEIERLKKRVAELEEPDTFWLSESDDVTPSSVTVEDAMEECEELTPYRIWCASTRPDFWVVFFLTDEEKIFRDFSTEEEAERFCREMREGGHA